MKAFDWSLVKTGTDSAAVAIEMYEARKRKTLSKEESEAVMQLISTMSTCILLVSQYAQALEERVS